MSADRPGRRTDLHDPLKSPTQKHEEPFLFRAPNDCRQMLRQGPYAAEHRTRFQHQLVADDHPILGETALECRYAGKRV
jgi:hypothetical protein